MTGAGLAESRRSPGGPSEPRVPALTELSIWYLALLGPTLLLKYLYLDTVYVGGLRAAVEVGASDPSGRALWALGAPFFTRDLLEVGFAAIVLFIIGRALGPAGRKVLIVSAVFGLIL